ncbi:MAG: hypothetical protein HDS25_06375 [Bacteroides sp.]|nr:hypothetical protein [Bacteroides sp.]
MKDTFRYDRWYADGRRRLIVGGCMAILLLIAVGIPWWYSTTSMSMGWFYNPWGVPEWLINYEGGFVRRGLTGEALYAVCRVTGVSPILLVYVISYALYVAVTGIMLRRFGDKHWAWWIVFALPLCGYVQSIVRKDYFMYLLIIGIFALLGRIKRGSREGGWEVAMIYLLTSVGMLSHEGFAFFGVGGACLYLWRVADMRRASLGLGLLTCLLFGIAVIARGDAVTADGIEGALNALGTLPPLPTEGAIDALRWQTGETFLNHMQINFRAPYKLLTDYPGLNYAVGAGVWLVRILIVYYTMTNLPAVCSAGVTEDERIKTRDTLGSMILLTWLTMLPMFTILCCDRSRTTQFWIMGAYIPVMMISLQKAERMIPKALARFTRSLNNRLTGLVAPRGGLLIFLMLLLLSSEVLTVVRKLL